MACDAEVRQAEYCAEQCCGYAEGCLCVDCSRRDRVPQSMYLADRRDARAMSLSERYKRCFGDRIVTQMGGI